MDPKKSIIAENRNLKKSKIGSRKPNIIVFVDSKLGEVILETKYRPVHARHIKIIPVSFNSKHSYCESKRNQNIMKAVFRICQIKRTYSSLCPRTLIDGSSSVSVLQLSSIHAKDCFLVGVFQLSYNCYCPLCYCFCPFKRTLNITLFSLNKTFMVLVII